MLALSSKSGLEEYFDELCGFFTRNHYYLLAATRFEFRLKARAMRRTD